MSLLSEVLANLCQKAGLAPSQVDLSLVTGTVEGFVVSNRASVRSSLEHLQRAHFTLSSRCAAACESLRVQWLPWKNAPLGHFSGGTTPRYCREQRQNPLCTAWAGGGRHHPYQ